MMVVIWTASVNKQDRVKAKQDLEETLLPAALVRLLALKSFFISHISYNGPNVYIVPMYCYYLTNRFHVAVRLFSRTS